jgi:hypothetical protein
MVAAIGLLCVPQFAVLSYATVFLHDDGHLGPGGNHGRDGGPAGGRHDHAHLERAPHGPPRQPAAYLRGSALVALAAFMLLGLAAMCGRRAGC